MATLIQYIIIRGDLAKLWPMGAIIAQACHASSAINYLQQEDEETKEYFKDLDNMHKCVLEAPDESTLRSLSKTFEENDILHKLWIEQPENIPTCIALKPYKKEFVQKFVKKLKLLK